MKCCHGNLVSSCEVVSGYADHDNNNDTQKNANEYNGDVRDFEDTTLKDNIFILRVYFNKSIKAHFLMNLFQGVFFEEIKRSNMLQSVVPQMRITIIFKFKC